VLLCQTKGLGSRSPDRPSRPPIVADEGRNAHCSGISDSVHENETRGPVLLLPGRARTDPYLVFDFDWRGFVVLARVNLRSMGFVPAAMSAMTEVCPRP
jgi:hypothetical protein